MDVNSSTGLVLFLTEMTEGKLTELTFEACVKFKQILISHNN